MAKYTVKRETAFNTNEILHTNDINRACLKASTCGGYGVVAYVINNETGKRVTATTQSCLAEFPDSVDVEYY